MKIKKLSSIWHRVGLLLLGGIGSFGFAPYYFYIATILSIGAAYHLLRGKGYGHSFWYGAGYGIANFYWCVNALLPNGQLWYFYVAGITGLFVICGAVFGAPFAMTNAAKAGSGWRRVVYFALACAFALWLRELFVCPWNPLANITLPSPRLSGAMSVVGALGLTFILAGCIASVPEYLKSKSKWQFVFFIPLLFFMLAPMNGKETESGKTARLVQPAFSTSEKHDFADKERILNILVGLSVEKSDFLPDIIVWPETAYPYDADITTKFPLLKTGLVSGAVYREGGASHNSLLYISRSGYIVDRYHKVHLVPFGEYRALGDWIPSAADFTPGDGPKVIDGFAPSICYDIAYSDSIVPKDSGRRPKYILNITNDAWLGHSAGVYQHLDMARRAAIETGLPVMFANNIGLSAVVNNRGVVLRKLPYGKAGFIDAIIPPYRNTIYGKIGLNRMMLWLILLSGFVLVIFGKKKR
jgi:apolipoprotein N-acyltransferase